MRAITAIDEVSTHERQVWGLSWRPSFERRIAASMAFSVVTLVLATTHAVNPKIQIDTVTLGLMVAAMLPWAATIMTSLKVPGGWEVEFRDVKDRLAHTEHGVEEMRGGVESLTHRADMARDVVLGGVVSSAPAAANAPVPGPQSEMTPSPDEQLRTLIRRYNAIRDSEASSAARSATLTGVVSEIIRLAPWLAGFNPARALSSDDNGTRLAGYAYLFALPDVSLLDGLVTAALEDDTRFGQYWGLQAVSRAIVLLKPSDMDLRTRVGDQLEALHTRLEREHRAGDRRYELKRILRLLDRA
jgi:hypothetical protein